MNEVIGFGIIVLIFIGAIRSRSKEIKRKQELEKIYAKLPDEDVKVLKKAIDDKEWEKQEDERRSKWATDPTYRALSGNIYHDNK